MKPRTKMVVGLLMMVPLVGALLYSLGYLVRGALAGTLSSGEEGFLEILEAWAAFGLFVFGAILWSGAQGEKLLVKPRRGPGS